MSWRDKMVPACSRTTSARWVVTTRAVHHRHAGHNRLMAELGGNPLGPSAECRVHRLDSASSSRFWPTAKSFPHGASPRATSIPWTRIA